MHNALGEEHVNLTIVIAGFITNIIILAVAYSCRQQAMQVFVVVLLLVLLLLRNTRVSI